MSLAQMMIYNSAPTLAGLKIGTIISVPDKFTAFSNNRTLENFNARFNTKGLHFKILCRCPKRQLLYIFRKERLSRYMLDEKVAAFLLQHGYKNTENIEGSLCYLSQRLTQKNGFPHELGIFLGYPLEDVKGFIENKGNNAKLCGEWKVYSNVASARQLFKKYTDCRYDYVNQYRKGVGFSELVVA